MLHVVPLAYKYVMYVAMVAFINCYAPKLNLPLKVPLQEQQVKPGIQPPIITKTLMLYGGGIRVKNYALGFSGGMLDNEPFVSAFRITKLEDDGMASFGIPLLHLHEASNSLMERASRMKYTISTNDLYRIGTNYLMALDIDPKNMETNGTLSVSQGIFHSNRGLVPSPLMDIFWKTSKLRDPGTNGMACMLSAVSGELLEMSVGNNCGCKGLPLIKDFKKLVAIPDEEFLKYSELDRSNLLARFVTCPAMITPDAVNLGAYFTTNQTVQSHVPRANQ
jgi:hypothetical protein